LSREPCACKLQPASRWLPQPTPVLTRIACIDVACVIDTDGCADSRSSENYRDSGGAVCVVLNDRQQEKVVLQQHEGEEDPGCDLLSGIRSLESISTHGRLSQIELFHGTHVVGGGGGGGGVVV